MEKLRITLELTLEEARLLVSELWQFRAAKEEANKQQPDPQPFQLEYGKRYKRRDGKITARRLEESGLKGYPFTDGEDVWMSDGSFSRNNPNQPYDLIEEA